jgi:hypothetical protein
MTDQVLFDVPVLTGKQTRDIGIKQAEDHANQVHDKWSDQAYKFALDYLKFHPAMMGEDIRKVSEGFIPHPPSLRAWGSIIVRLRKEGLITQVGFNQVRNPKAHCANAACWKSNLYKS